MTAPRRSSEPTGAELQILRVLWSRGEATVREVHEQIVRSRGVAYTTVLKLMQIMTKKGQVTRTTAGRAHVYRAARSERAVQGALLDDLLERAFGGSVGTLAMCALQGRALSDDDRHELQRLLAEPGPVPVPSREDPNDG